MTTNSGFPPFLSEYAEDPEQPDIGKAWDRGVILPRILKTSILGAAVAAIVFAILSVAKTDKSTPIFQSAASTQALWPIASEAPTDDETAATFKAADQKQTEIRQPPAKALLSQFRAWAANEDARARSLFAGNQTPSGSFGIDQGSRRP